MLALIRIPAKQRERVEHEGALQSHHAESHRRESMTILFILCTARQLREDPNPHSFQTPQTKLRQMMVSEV